MVREVQAVTAFLTSLAAMLLALAAIGEVRVVRHYGMRHRRLDAGSGAQTTTNSTSIGGCFLVFRDGTVA